MKLTIVLGMICLAGVVEAAEPTCSYRLWYDDQREYCFPCSSSTPPWGTASRYAYFKQWLVLCRGCNVLCQTSTYKEGVSESSCAASVSNGEHLADALIYGIVDAESNSGYRAMMHKAPELALFLLSQRLDKGKAPQADMTFNRAMSSYLPTSQFVALVERGQDIGSEQVARFTQELPKGHSLLMEAKTEVLDSGRAVLRLRSAIVNTDDRSLVAELNAYSVRLMLVESATAKTRQFESVKAKVYRVVGIAPDGG